MGYTLDDGGGVNGYASTGGTAPDVTNAPSFNFDIARGIVGGGSGNGYVLDGWGGIHPYGNAPAATGGAYWQGWDIARGVAAAGASGGEVVDGWGGVHPFWTSGAASQNPPQVSGYWPGTDRARGIG